MPLLVLGQILLCDLLALLAGDRLPAQDVGVPGRVVQRRWRSTSLPTRSSCPSTAGTGAAIALVLSGAVQLSIFGALSQHYFPISYEKRQILKLVIAAAIAFVLGSLIEEPLALSIGVEVAIIAAVPLVLLAAGFFSPVEVDAGRRALRQTAATVRGWRSGAA